MRRHLVNKVEICISHLLSYAAFLCLAQTTNAEVITIDSGSYTTDRTQSSHFPKTIYRMDNIAGAVPTNQWWSSLVWKQYSQPLFTHPLAVKFSEAGLALTYPGQGLVGSHNAIMGAGVDGDITISQVGTESYTDARLAAQSDWFITAETRGQGNTLKATFGHGSPFVYLRHSSSKAQIRCKSLQRVGQAIQAT